MSHEPSPASERPVLEAEGARVAVDGATAIEELSLQSRGQRVLLLGDAAALLAVLTGAPLGRAAGEPSEPTGRARLVRGELRLRGRDVGKGKHHAAVGSAPLEPPLPGSWRLAEYLEWSARLAGFSRRKARFCGAASLDRLDLGGRARQPLRKLERAERRAAVLAQALVTEPEVLLCEDPLAGLGRDEASFVLDLLARATEGRAAVVWTPRLAASEPGERLARTATDVCVLRAGRLLLHAGPSALFDADRLYEITVRSRAAELRALLAAEGVELQGGPVHFSASLPADWSATNILAAAARARAAVVSCLPLLA